MSLSNTLIRAVYQGNAATTAFAIPADIIIDDSTEILVYVRDESVDPATESLQTEGSDYSLTGAPDVNSFHTTVTFTTAPGANDKVLIYRSLPLTQTLDAISNGEFKLTEHESAYDRMVAMIQQVNERVDRSALLPITSSTTGVALPEPTAGKALLWNAGGTSLENSTDSFGDIVTDSEAAQAAAEAAQTAAELAQTGAETAETNAQDWATKVDGIVDATDYSSKAWSIGGTGVTDTASAGAAKEWATKAEDSTVDGSGFSALHYSAKSSASATASAASATLAQNAVASMIWNDVVFLTSADSPYTVTNSQRGKLLAVNCSSGAVTINLPSIAALDLTSAFVLGIKKTDSSGNSITIARDGTDTIDGASSKIISVADSGATFIPDTDPAPDEWTSANFGSSGGNLTINNFSGDNSTVAFVLSVDAGTENNTFVYIDGVYQQKNTYSLSGTTLTFSTAPPTGTDNIEVSIGSFLSIGTPSDGTVTRAKLADGAVANKTVVTKTTAYTATSLDNILLCNASGAAFTVTLPTAVGISGKELVIKKIGSDYNNVTIDGDGTETIDGSTTYVLYLPNEYIKIVSDGTNWQLIQEHLEPVACAATYSGSTGDTTGVIPFDGATYDTTSGLNTGTGIFTTKAPGKYRVGAISTISLSGNPANDFVDIMKNAVDIGRAYNTSLTGSTTTSSACATVTMDLVEGDTIKLEANGDASFSITSECKMFIDRISR